MSKICKVTINDEPFLANRGELLLDWALMNGIDLPHDCRSGICGACRVRLVDGTVFGGHSRGDDMIHACQARIVSDLRDCDRGRARAGGAVGRSGSDRSARARRGRRRDRTAEAARLPSRPVLQTAVSGIPGKALQPDLSAGRRSPRSPAALSHPKGHGRTGILGARPRNPPRAPRQADGTVRPRLFQARPSRPHRSRRQRHRFRADVVGRGRRDHGAAAARNGLHRGGTQHPLALHACGAVPAGAVSQRHADPDGVGAAADLARHPERPADRSSAGTYRRTTWSIPRARRR